MIHQHRTELCYMVWKVGILNKSKLYKSVTWFKLKVRLGEVTKGSAKTILEALKNIIHKDLKRKWLYTELKLWKKDAYITKNYILSHGMHIILKYRQDPSMLKYVDGQSSETGNNSN